MEGFGDKHWYVITCYSGNEQKVKFNIERRIESMNLADQVFRVIVVEEEVQRKNKDGSLAYVEKDGVKTPKMKTINLCPGYVYVEMVMTDESWFMIRNTPLVTGIAGSSGGGQKPIPVPPNEMEAILKKVGVVDVDMYDEYKVGDYVKITNGTFAKNEGIITEIDKEKGTVKVDAVFFGRHVSVDCDFTDILHVN